MYHRVEDFRDTLREMRETRRIARTMHFGTYESLYEKRRTLVDAPFRVDAARVRHRTRSLDPQPDELHGDARDVPWDVPRVPHVDVNYLARGAPAGTGTGDGDAGTARAPPLPADERGAARRVRQGAGQGGEAPRWCEAPAVGVRILGIPGVTVTV